MTQDYLNLKITVNCWKNNQLQRQHHNLQLKVVEKKNHEQTIGQFTKMVENNTIMVNFFEKPNVLLERIIHQMD
jgi:hypothetical protein